MTSTFPRFDGTQNCASTTPQQRGSFEGLATPEPAKELCAGCHFRTPCQTYALEHDVTGVWGGLDDAARHTVRGAMGLPEPVTVSDELDELVLAGRAANQLPRGSQRQHQPLHQRAS